MAYITSQVCRGLLRDYGLLASRGTRAMLTQQMSSNGPATLGDDAFDGLSLTLPLLSRASATRVHTASMARSSGQRPLCSE